MADFPLIDLTTTGDFFTPCTATGDTFDNGNPGTTLLIRNKNANPRTIVFKSPNTCCFGVVDPVHDLTVTIAGDGGTNGMYMRVRLDPTRFNNPLNQQVNVTYTTGVAGLAIAVMQYVQ